MAKRTTSDLREALHALERALRSAHGRSPTTDKRQTALHDGWRTILKPRVRRWLAALDDLTAPRRWAFDDVQDVATQLRPTHWDHAVRRCLAPLQTSLGGALRQYHTIRLVWRAKVRFGARRGANAPIGSRKSIDAQKKEAAKQLEKAREAAQKAYAKTLKQVLDAWAKRRSALEEALLTLRRLTIALLLREEQRLEGLAKQAPEARRAAAREGLARMKALRHDLEGQDLDDGREASRWSGALRRWLGARRKAARALA